MKLLCSKAGRLAVLVSISLIAITSCGKGSSGNAPVTPTPTPTPSKTSIPINISTSIWGTKATDTGFETNDKVGIFIVNYSGSTPGTLAVSGNHATNISFTFSGSAWTGSSALYWIDETTKADFYCYYPYSPSVSSVTAFPFSVNVNQSIEANYKSSDLLWGKTSAVSPTSAPVPITVKHTMSNLLVYLKPGTGFTQAQLDAATKSIVITNTKPNSTVNLSDGSVTATGTVADISAKQENGYFRALIVPQTVNSVDLIRITIDGKAFTFKQTIDFISNKQYKCTLTVNKIDEGIDIGIGGWDNDGTDYGGTV